MKLRLFLITVFALLTASLWAQSLQRVKQQAQAIANALLKQDYATLLKYTHPNVIALGGGKVKMLTTVKTQMQGLQNQGINIKSAEIGEPGPIISAGMRRFCLVPERITLQANNTVVSQPSNFLAISDDKGANWYFIDLSLGNDDLLYRWFPEIKGKLILPQRGRTAISGN